MDLLTHNARSAVEAHMMEGLICLPKNKLRRDQRLRADRLEMVHHVDPICRRLRFQAASWTRP